MSTWRGRTAWLRVEDPPGPVRMRIIRDGSDVPCAPSTKNNTETRQAQLDCTRFEELLVHEIGGENVYDWTDDAFQSAFRHGPSEIETNQDISADHEATPRSDRTITLVVSVCRVWNGIDSLRSPLRCLGCCSNEKSSTIINSRDSEDT